MQNLSSSKVYGVIIDERITKVTEWASDPVFLFCEKINTYLDLDAWTPQQFKIADSLELILKNSASYYYQYFLFLNAMK